MAAPTKLFIEIIKKNVTLKTPVTIKVIPPFCSA